ncbi:uncharacterized protein LOC133814216 [Humulus lupulus]|uniref:uncharacterized protein LOC133814216 n=1 Tax=Humulus lupulus TaxID=3486 RepID=UPI002B403F53|nr:uncharacterized protein LOC133814216 [Humulus lupulus]
MAYDFEPVYERFRKQAPPSFEGNADHMVAEDWVKSVEAIFDHMEMNDHQRISCVANLLKMDARIWWDMVKQTRDLNTMTWVDFIQAFNKKYYITVVLATRVDEVVTLFQGNLSIADYAHKFDRLARFTSKIVPTEAMRVARFKEGLKSMIARDVKLTNVKMVSYAKVLDKALDVEYLEERIWKDSVERRVANRNKGF